MKQKNKSSTKNLVLDKKLLFDRQFERELSLFSCVVWEEGDRFGLKKWLGQGLAQVLFVKKAASPLITIYYDRTELDYFDKLIRDKTLKDHKFFPKVKKYFLKYWQPLKPYAQGRKISSIKEFGKFYQNLTAWWPLMSLIYWIPAPDSLTFGGPQVTEAKHLRKQTEKFSDDSELLFLDFFKKQYPKYAQYAEIITPAEVFSLFNKPFSKLQLKTFDQRKKQGFIYQQSQLQPLNKIKALSFNPLPLATNQLTGQIAFKGKVTGKVRVVNLTSEINTLKPGEILVAHMTNPRYLPAIKKAAAIITDEGGITCHAAISARELKKPTIIGTKVATEVLKTGDQIELNANTGVIKILKRHAKTKSSH
ncbi:MAG: PEP-utilizing enzyme [Candidatus Komeilibacteria bacterium]|nr:PEP-utilizing enzyme [Candidatus Komeilibacteria bacterium]